ncbi:chemosensory receptor a [Plakobranchus ocellatus]|uniref:Chemosensory receptor a n=1 Tax=Plakobranchus ocellatus TaxID=259542 RepID=A0AAV3YL44_9GAST|nr:chemosensory receptor a [Plakobranchus ocellatus]
MVNLTPLNVQELGQSASSIPDISDLSKPISPIISDKIRYILFVIFVQVIQLIFASFGIFNLVNAIVYIKMGFSEMSSITLTALSLADLVTELWLLLMAASVRIGHSFLNVIPLSVTIMYVLSTANNAVLGYGSWITAIISVERCLCIVIPMKVGPKFGRTCILC